MIIVFVFIIVFLTILEVIVIELVDNIGFIIT